jgi:hypothetical protein
MDTDNIFFFNEVRFFTKLSNFIFDNSLEADSYSTWQEVPTINAHHRIHKSLPPNPVYSYLFSVHVRFPSQSSNFLILSSNLRLRATSGLFLSGFRTQVIYIFSTFRCVCKAQPVNAVWGNSRCLLWEPYGTHRYTVWAECRVLVC